MNGDNFSAFRYGFLSAQISQVLQEYLETSSLTPSSRGRIADGHALLKDIVTAQKTFVTKDEADRSSAPTYDELDAFTCALHVILANRDEFGVSDTRSFTQFFDGMYCTLNGLWKNNEVPDRAHIIKARTFFQRLADAMLAQMSFPTENHPDPQEAHFFLA